VSDKAHWTTEEAAVFLSLEPDTLRLWRNKSRRTGRLLGPPWIDLGEGRRSVIRYRREDVERHVAARPSERCATFKTAKMQYETISKLVVYRIGGQKRPSYALVPANMSDDAAKARLAELLGVEVVAFNRMTRGKAEVAVTSLPPSASPAGVMAEMAPGFASFGLLLRNRPPPATPSRRPRM